MQLLRPATMETLQSEPYASAVFMHCFISLAKDEDLYTCDETALEDHIVKGYSHVSYRQKVEMCLEYQDNLFMDHIFRERIMSRVSPALFQHS